jgi:hypothetical protein
MLAYDSYGVLYGGERIRKTPNIDRLSNNNQDKVEVDEKSGKDRRANGKSKNELR